ncbi:hypothetical protein D3C87_1304420 [compost metagenome]
MQVFTDFEGNELRLGDKVLTPDLDKKGGLMRRGEVVRFCDVCVKIEIEAPCRVTGHITKRTIQRADAWIALVARDPEREKELSAK